MWRGHQTDGLKTRHRMGRMLDDQFGPPGPTQPRGQAVLKKAAERLGLDESQLSRMRNFAHHFREVENLLRRYPGVNTWTEVKKLLVSLKEKEKAPAAPESSTDQPAPGANDSPLPAGTTPPTPAGPETRPQRREQMPRQSAREAGPARARKKKRRSARPLLKYLDRLSSQIEQIAPVLDPEEARGVVERIQELLELAKKFLQPHLLSSEATQAPEPAPV